MMSNFFEFIKLFGFSVNENSSPLVLLFCVILFFACIALLSVFNISIYLLSLYLLNNQVFLNKIEIKYPYLIKIINYYKSTRIGFIIIELCFLIFSLVYIISLCYRFILKLL
nr:hypothetical protein [Grifola frondosa]